MASLTRFISAGRERGEKGQFEMQKVDLAKNKQETRECPTDHTNSAQTTISAAFRRKNRSCVQRVGGVGGGWQYFCSTIQDLVAWLACAHFHAPGRYRLQGGAAAALKIRSRMCSGVFVFIQDGKIQLILMESN